MEEAPDDWAVGEHWRSGAYHSHLSLRLNAHIRPARAERRHIGSAPETQHAAPAHDTLGRNGVPETKHAELAQHALAGCPLSHGTCGGLAYSAPGYERVLATPCA